jgi:hypothetical protein
MTTGHRRPADPKPAASARPLEESFFFEGEGGLAFSEGQGPLAKKSTGDLAGRTAVPAPAGKCRFPPKKISENYSNCQKFFPLLGSPIIPLPPFKKWGELQEIAIKVPLWQRGLSWALKNLQPEGICGKRYNLSF